MNDRNRAGPDWLTLFSSTNIFFALVLVIFFTQYASAEVCLDCHDEMAESVKGTTHEHPAVACASCHSGDEHAEDPSTENITIPSLENELGQLATCTSCHQPHLQMDQAGFDPHLTQGMTCLTCHNVHQPESRLLLDDSGEFCGKCHMGTKRQFERRSTHPLEEDIMTCWSCHDFVGSEPNLSHGSTESCLSCHAEQAGPYLFEHQGLGSFTTEGGGCVSCHSPHGSSNERMLKQPGDGLCRQCHGVPVRHATAHSGVFSNIACVNCHSEIHGSHEDSNLLDPMIGSKYGDGPDGCFCHTAGN